MTAVPAPDPLATSPHATTGLRRLLGTPLDLCLLLLVALSAVTLLKPDGDVDLWHRLAMGKLIVESGEVPRQDVFAYTATRAEWIDHEWGAALVFYGLAALGGQRGLLVLKAVLLFGAVTFVYLRARRALGRAPSLAFHLLVVGSLVFGYLPTIRPQAFTFCFASLWLFLLERARGGDWRWAWLIPATNLIWPNLHGGFLAGLGFVGLYAGAELLQRRSPLRFGLLAAVAAAASLANPYGFGLWHELFEATTKDRATINEWQPPNLLGGGVFQLGFRVLLVLSVLGLVLGALRRRLPDLATLLVVVVTGALALRVTKHMSLFVIASAPFVCAWTTAEWRRLADRFRTVAPIERGAAWLGRGLLSAATGYVLATIPLRIVLFDSFPARAVDFIAENGLKGNLLVPFSFGGYAMWRLYPDCRVSMDGRYDAAFLDQTYHEVRAFFRGEPGCAALLDRYPHDLILAPRGRRLEAELATRRDWAVAYEDRRHRVYVPASRQRAWPPLAPPNPADPCATAGKPRYVP
jgi:hypothetical protein